MRPRQAAASLPQDGVIVALQIRKYCFDFLRGIIIVMLWIGARIEAVAGSKFSIAYSNTRFAMYFVVPAIALIFLSLFSRREKIVAYLRVHGAWRAWQWICWLFVGIAIYEYYFRDEFALWAVMWTITSAFIAVRAWEKYIPQNVQMHAYTQAGHIAAYLIFIGWFAKLTIRCLFEIHEMLGMNALEVIF